MPTFDIKIAKTETRVITIRVKGSNMEEAKMNALDEAPKHDFSHGEIIDEENEDYFCPDGHRD